MSTLTVGTISDGTNSTSSTNCIRGSAKAWVNWNGNGTATISASYGVSSVTRNATGDYTINFTTAFSDTNYVGVFGTGYTIGNPANYSMTVLCNKEGVPPTTSSVRVTANYANGAVTDTTPCSAAFFR